MLGCLPLPHKPVSFVIKLVARGVSHLTAASRSKRLETLPRHLSSALAVAGAEAAAGEARTQGRCRAVVEGRVAGAGEVVGEARARGRCRVTVGMVD